MWILAYKCTTALEMTALYKEKSGNKTRSNLVYSS